MFKQLHKDNKGFTIIEVLIVLAIAGLIMLIVFLAVPALQRNQRNNSRNNDASRITSAVTECLSNRNGSKTDCDAPGDIQPGTMSQLVTIGPATFTDSAATDLGTGSTTSVVIGYQRKCNTAGSNDEPGTGRDFAVMYQLEGSPLINRCLDS